MQKFKRLEDLTITDDFMFSQVMKDEEICKGVIETILGIKVGKIKFITSQHEIEITPEAKSITLDVYLRDEEKIINVELQNGHRLELPKRCRYYQAVADIDNTLPGDIYSKMKDNYVIFICTFDPFLQGKAFYRFENICMDCNPPLPLRDGTYKLFLNTAAEDLTLLDPELKLFYDYIRRGTADSGLTGRIESSINKLKENTEVRRKYMTWEMLKQDTYDSGFSAGEEHGFSLGRNEGIAIGEERGRNEGISLGITQGVHQKAVETAKNALSMNLTLEQIANLTGLSIETIQDLANK